MSPNPARLFDIDHATAPAGDTAVEHAECPAHPGEFCDCCVRRVTGAVCEAAGSEWAGGR